MAKFCTSCGTQVTDEANNCPNCGAPVGSPAPAAYSAPSAPAPTAYAAPEASDAGATTPKSGNTATYIRIGIVAVIAIIVIALVVVFFGGHDKDDKDDIETKPSYETPIDNMFEGLEKKDSDKFLSAYPKFISDRVEDWYGDFDDHMDDMYDSLVDDYGKNIKISYKVIDKKKINKDNLEYYEDDIMYMFDEKVDVSAGYEVEIETKIKGKDDEEEDDMDLTILKIDGDWCIYEGRMFY